MSSQIRVNIDAEGNVQADFIAFPGRTCEHAEKRLRDALARWGVEVKGTIVAKSEQQVLREAAQPHQPGRHRWNRIAT